MFLRPFNTIRASFNDLNKQKLHPNCAKYFIYLFFLNLGTFMYNMTDGAGWCFTAYCNSTCNVEKHARPCQSTTPPPSTTVTITTKKSSTATASTVTTSSVNVDCSFLTPPRKVLEFKCSTS